MKRIGVSLTQIISLERASFKFSTLNLIIPGKAKKNLESSILDEFKLYI